MKSNLLVNTISCLVLFLFVFSIFANCFNLPIIYANSENLALNKYVVYVDNGTGSREKSSGPIAGAVDGDDKTGFDIFSSSKIVKGFLIVDLGETTTFNQVVIKETVKRKLVEYSIDISGDRVEWKTVAQIKKPEEIQKIDFDAVAARFVRLNIIETGYSPYITGFEVYSDGSPATFTADSSKLPENLASPPKVGVDKQLITELAPPKNSKIVFPDASGRLQYVPVNDRGDLMPDFSYVGYKQGMEDIPNAPVKVTLEPSTGDDTERIQAAIDEVSAFSLDENGLRGAILLKKGKYNISKSLNINASGVIIRGEGNDENGTVITGIAKETIRLIVAGGSLKRTVIGENRNIIDTYVPVGTRKVTVDDASDINPGDEIVVVVTPNDEWIKFIKMDAESGILVGSGVEPWKASEYKMTYERIATAVNGNTITFDVPMVMAIEQKFGGGYVYKSDSSERIENVGVENLRLDSTFDESVTQVYDIKHEAYPPETYYADQNKAKYGISFSGPIKNYWATDVVITNISYGITMGGKWGTIKNCSYLDPVSKITGSERYGFTLYGQQILVIDCYSRKARHAFTTGQRIAGPNAFVNCISEEGYAKAETHQRWATGTLYDNVTSTGVAGGLASFNRGTNGSGHGWSGAQTVFWNCTAAYIGVESPPTATNFAIGLGGLVKDEDIIYSQVIGYIKNMAKWSHRNLAYEGNPIVGDAYVESNNGPVNPRSLYLKQLEDRKNASSNKLLGAVALMVDNPNAFVNNEKTKVDVNNPEVMPIVMDGRTLVPVRFISESFGAQVEWDQDTSTVTIKYKEKTIQMVLGSSNMIVNGVESQLDVPAQTVNGRTLIPLRALVETLGKNVFWDERGLIVISDGNSVLNADSDKTQIDELINNLK